MMAGAAGAAKSVRLVMVGDVHDDWDPVLDAKALQLLQPDLVLFTGDFGDENVPVVANISRLEFPKVAILGNHDCWWSTGYFANRKVFPPGAERDAVKAQLDLLGDAHIGYGRADFPNLQLSVVGGRPGSGGGTHIGSSSLAKKIWNVRNMKESTQRIVERAMATPTGHILVFLAHNGPTGLGARPEDICGKDWILEGGDHGDPDLALALSHVKEQGKRKVPLIVFGHMHKALQNQLGDRKMIVIGQDESVYLNAAVVPRIRSCKAETAAAAQTGREVVAEEPNWLDDPADGMMERNFTVVDLVDGEPKKIKEVWVNVAEQDARIAELTVLYSRN